MTEPNTEVLLKALAEYDADPERNFHVIERAARAAGWRHNGPIGGAVQYVLRALLAHEREASAARIRTLSRALNDAATALEGARVTHDCDDCWQASREARAVLSQSGGE